MSENIDSQIGQVEMPNPGSDAAIALNCSCPILDNNHGKGIESKEGTLFWMNEDCPLHGPEDWTKND